MPHYSISSLSSENITIKWHDGPEKAANHFIIRLVSRHAGKKICGSAKSEPTCNNSHATGLLKTTQ